MGESDRPLLVALGNGVWLDEIRKEGDMPIEDVPGGSVTFEATLGARLFASARPGSISMVFNAGADFPDTVVQLFRNWSVDLTVHCLTDKPSSRGLVFYQKENSNRKGFQRITDPLPVTIKDLQDTRLLLSQAFEFFGTAEYITEQTQLLRDLQPQSRRWDRPEKPPVVIWEPHAKSCLPDTLRAHLEAAKLVDVFSPNHEELASFFEDGTSNTIENQVIERQAKVFVDAGIGPSGEGCMLVRCADKGCLITIRGYESVWLPPFHESDSSNICDPTGAGNGFLGAFAIGWHETGSYVEAAKYGQVAASFMIEQIGTPLCSGSGEEELWNGNSVRKRLEAYRERVHP